MIDIYNEKLAKYADGERRIFTATFLRPDDRKGIFQNLTVNNEDNVVVKQIALRMNKAFKELDLEKGDVVQIAPDVEHWHGACAKHPMTHISIETNVPNNKAIWRDFSPH